MTTPNEHAPSDNDQTDEQNTSKNSDKPEANKKKKISGKAKFFLWTGLIIVAVLVVIWFMYYQTKGKYLESTDDAYIHADSVTVSPKVSGYIEKIDVEENQHVKAGQLLVSIDSRDYSAQTEQYKAQINVAKASEENAQAALKEQISTIAQAKAQLVSAQADARFADSEVARYIPLVKNGAETQEKLNNLRNQAAQMHANMAAKQAAVIGAQNHNGSIEAQINQAKAQADSARAQYNAANVNLTLTEIRASIDGRVGNKEVRIGQYVSAGSRLMTVVPNSFYITANYKETQIGLMRVGQPASIKIDALPGQTFNGHVESVAPGTGAQFSLLPPQNATGNFTKIVQRVPVRIAVDVEPQLKRLFAAGLSVVVEVNTIAAKDEMHRLKDQHKENQP